MEKIEIKIHTEFITFANLLKLAGIIQTGGQVIEFIEEENATLNGLLIFEKRKKIRPGDVVNIDNKVEITVKEEE
jgi:ribosome-associated protein